MSRSRRHSPYMGVTTATSDRAFKDACHGAERANLRAALSTETEPADRRVLSDVWRADKDGRQRIRDPRWMRK